MNMEVSQRVQIRQLHRLPNSASGNPRWRVDTSEGSWWTAQDSQCGGVLGPSWIGKHALVTIRSGEIVAVAE